MRALNVVILVVALAAAAFVLIPAGAGGAHELEATSSAAPRAPSFDSVGSQVEAARAPVRESPQADEELSQAAPAQAGAVHVLVRESGGSPVRGAFVQWVQLGRAVATAETDSGGRAALPEPALRHPSEMAQFIVSAAGHAPQLAFAGPGMGSAQAPIEVELAPGALLTSTWYDSRGARAAGVHVRVRVPLRELAAGEPAPAASENGGTVRRRDWFTGVELRGLDSAGLREWTAITDDAGRASFVDLPAEVELRFDARLDDVAFPDIATARVELAQRQSSIEVTLPERRRLSGSVVDRAGAAVAHHAVWAVPARAKRDFAYLDASDAPVQRTETDARGHFEFARLPAGAYHVGLAPESSPKESAERVPAFAIFVDLREERGSPLELIVDRGVYLRGLTVDAAGAPAPDVLILTTPEAGGGALMSTSGSDGTFLLGPLQRVAHNLHAQWSEGGPSQRVAHVVPGDEVVLVELGRAGALTLQCVGIDGSPATLRSALLIESDRIVRAFDWRASAPFEATLESLRPGTYRIVARTQDEGMAIVDSVEVRAGDRSRLALTAQPMGKLRITQEHGAFTNHLTLRDEAGALFAQLDLEPGQSVLAPTPQGRIAIESVGRPERSSPLVAYVLANEIAEVRVAGVH